MVDLVPHDIASQIFTNLVASGFIESLKQSKYVTWITEETTTINKLVSVIISSASAAGIVFSVSHTGPGAGTLAWQGLTLLALVHWAWNTIVNYYSQKAWFKLLFANTPLLTRLANGNGGAVVGSSAPQAGGLKKP